MADPVAEGRLPEPAVTGPLGGVDLAGGDVDEVDAAVAERDRERDRVVAVEAAVDQSVAEIRTESGR